MASMLLLVGRDFLFMAMRFKLSGIVTFDDLQKTKQDKKK